MRLLSLSSIAALYAAMKADVRAELAPPVAAPAPMRGTIRRRRVRVSNFVRKPLLSRGQAAAAADRQTHERRLREYRRDPVHCGAQWPENRELKAAIEAGLRDRGLEVTA